VSSSGATAGVFDNTAGGKIFSAQVNGTEKASIDGGGTITATGLTINSAITSGNALNLTSSVVTGQVNGISGAINTVTDFAAGVLGQTLASGGTSFGVQGFASASNPNGVGVQGQAANAGVRGFANGTDPKFTPVGVAGTAINNPSGIGVSGTGSAFGVTGTSRAASGVGVSGSVQNEGAVAGVFDNSAGGKVLSGRQAGKETFSVSASGYVLAQGLQSTAPLGTAPIVVTSNTTVPNLTASNHPTVFGCGSSTTCPSSSQLSSGATVALHTLIGSVSAPAGSVTVNFGTVGFTSLSTYVCTANANLNGAVVSVSQTTGTSVTFNVNATAATVNYICIGN
jgi:hypothetical protein